MRGTPIAHVIPERQFVTFDRRADTRSIEESDMELTSSNVERKATLAHDAVDAAAVTASEKAAAPAIDRVARAAHDTVDKVAQAAGPAADWLNQNAEQLKRQQQELVDGCRSYIRERPLVAIGIALAAGYLAGRLVR
ncbi:MAG: hypothetical protein M3R31_01670 [Pseudomonadota bacterium]|nr:hypothetical protein [Pseudomonadota bacterium]